MLLDGSLWSLFLAGKTCVSCRTHAIHYRQRVFEEYPNPANVVPFNKQILPNKNRTEIMKSMQFKLHQAFGTVFSMSFLSSIMFDEFHVFFIPHNLFWGRGKLPPGPRLRAVPTYQAAEAETMLGDPSGRQQDSSDSCSVSKFMSPPVVWEKTIQVEFMADVGDVGKKMFGTPQAVGWNPDAN